MRILSEPRASNLKFPKKKTRLRSKAVAYLLEPAPRTSAELIQLITTKKHQLKSVVESKSPQCQMYLSTTLQLFGSMRLALLATSKEASKVNPF